MYKDCLYIVASPGQKSGACGHLMAGSHCAHFHDKEQRFDLCLMRQEYILCNALTTDQKTQLATPPYKLKKEKKADKKDSSNDSSTLIDPDQVSVLRAVNPKLPEKNGQREPQE